jgi:N-methylhydantoinase A
VPRHLRLPVPERLDNTGRVLRALDEAALRGLIPLLRQENVESIAVGLLHAFVNPVHELRIRTILQQECPDIPVSLSSEVSPEMREWERFSTTVANAYVQPMMEGYLRRLEADLHDAGATAPLFLMMSGGGLTTIETACRFPIRLVESGPAGGAIFSAHIARECGLDRVLSFDMGGTTAKICLIDDYRPQTARSFEVARVGRFRKGSGLPLRIPVVEMVEIGAGGGSIAHVDTLGRIGVGPESAGADPGPACYGRGGKHPAVTDANLALGRYDPTRFAGGSMTLDASAADTALLAEVGVQLGLSAQLSAVGVVEMVDENMANAARVHAIESGKTYEGRTLIAFGGGGPVHACRIAEKAGITRIVVPSGAGVGSAIGFLRAPVGYEVVRSLYQRFSSLNLAAINDLLVSMQQEALTVVQQGSFGAPVTETLIAYMRYVGQGHEIPVPLPARPLTREDAATIRVAYDREYARFFDRPVPGSDVEILSYAVVVSTVTEVPPASVAAAVSPADATTERWQSVRDTTTGAVSDWAVHERAKLSPGVRIVGPAIVTEDETSTLIGPGWTAMINGRGYIELVRDT